MDQITINSIKIEQAELINRLMIDAPLSENDIKVGLCLLHEILTKMKDFDKSNNVMRD
ncbi:hypothetical protein [Gilliamella apicola]|uniref:hypothetical protein n=1 Tax=Gilliamella apicola TaxID=1196095 RepID=UPI0016429264|nr:hypothetical protein [Gilliamella apicola]